MSHQVVSDHIVWLNEQDRTASFHYVEGYNIQTFSCHEFFNESVRLYAFVNE